MKDIEEDPLICECFPLPPMLVFSISQEIESFSDLISVVIFVSGQSYDKLIFLPSRPMVGTLGEKTLRSVFTHSLNSHSSASHHSSSLLSYPV